MADRRAARALRVLLPTTRTKQAALLVAVLVAIMGALVIRRTGEGPVLVAVLVLSCLSLTLLVVVRRLALQLVRRVRGIERAARSEATLRSQLDALQSAITSAVGQPTELGPNDPLVAALTHHIDDALGREAGRRRDDVRSKISQQLAALERRLRTARVADHRQVEALLDLRGLLPGLIGLPPTRGWAASPDFLLAVVRWTLRQRPAVVVECGSGSSTVYLGHALRRVGQGRLIALEHDEAYAARTRAVVREQELDDVVEVRSAPLDEWEIDGQSWHWYSREAVKDVTECGLLVVDGPPEATGPHARFPAVPVLHHALHAGAAVFLDDARREDEKAVVDRWLRLYPDLTHDYFEHEKGTSVLHTAAPQPERDAPEAGRVT